MLLWTQTANSSQAAEPILLRGVFFSGDNQSFSLHLPDQGGSVWLQLGQNRHGIKPLNYDSLKGELVLEHQGVRRTVKLATLDNLPLAVINNASVATFGSTHSNNVSNYHDQQPNPEAAALVLAAVEARQREASLHSDSPIAHTSHSVNGGRSNISSAPESRPEVVPETPAFNELAPIFRRNRVYNVDYAAIR